MNKTVSDINYPPVVWQQPVDKSKFNSFNSETTQTPFDTLKNSPLSKKASENFHFTLNDSVPIAEDVLMCPNPHQTHLITAQTLDINPD